MELKMFLDPFRSQGVGWGGGRHSWWRGDLGLSTDQITLFCSMDRNTDRDPQKQLDQKAMDALARNPHDGLLVTNINQTQDLLVTTVVLLFTSDAYRS